MHIRTACIHTFPCANVHVWEESESDIDGREGSQKVLKWIIEQVMERGRNTEKKKQIEEKERVEDKNEWKRKNKLKELENGMSIYRMRPEIRNGKWMNIRKNKTMNKMKWWTKEKKN